MEPLLLHWLMVSQDLESNSLLLLLSKILSTRTLWPEFALIFLLIGDATIAVSMSITWPPGVAMVWDGRRSLTFLGLPPEGVMEIPLLVSWRVNAGLWNALRLVSSRNRDFLCKRKRHRINFSSQVLMITITSNISLTITNIKRCNMLTPTWLFWMDVFPNLINATSEMHLQRTRKIYQWTYLA